MQTKHKITLLVMWVTALAQASMTLYLPAFPAIAHDLQIDPTVVKNTITLFMLGYGFSQFFYGPLSDRYGRKPILLIGITIYCVGCFINIFAHSQEVFLAARLLQGLGCGSAITIGRSILRDSFEGKEFASATSYLSMGFAIGLGISPVIGGYLVHYISWRADFVCLFIFGITLLLIFWRWLPETANDLETKHNLPQFFIHTLKNYRSIISKKSFVKFLIGGVFAYGVVVAYNVMTPFLIQKVLGFSAQDYGWLTLLVAIPYYIAASFNRKLVIKFDYAPLFVFGIGMILLGGVMMLLTVLNSKVSLIAIMLPIMLATLGQGLVFPNSISSALKDFPSATAGKASAMFSSLQMLLIGVLAAIFAIPADNSQLPLAIVLIILGVLSGVVLYREMFKQKNQ